MKSHKEVNIPKIEQSILKISNVIKEVAVFIHNNWLIAQRKCPWVQENPT
jgi:hypothetical protein